MMDPKEGTTTSEDRRHREQKLRDQRVAKGHAFVAPNQAIDSRQHDAATDVVMDDAVERWSSFGRRLCTFLAAAPAPATDTDGSVCLHPTRSG